MRGFEWFSRWRQKRKLKGEKLNNAEKKSPNLIKLVAEQKLTLELLDRDLIRLLPERERGNIIRQIQEYGEQPFSNRQVVLQLTLDGCIAFYREKDMMEKFDPKTDYFIELSNFVHLFILQKLGKFKQ